MRRFKTYGILACLWVSLAVAAGSPRAQASPVSTSVVTQHITIKVKRTQGNATFLTKGLEAKVIAKQVQWQYVSDTVVSVPYVQIQLTGFPVPNHYNVLVERSQQLPVGTDGPILTLPLLKKHNQILLTIVDPSGRFEEWAVNMDLNLTETAVYVDESCRDYKFKIRELRRTSDPSLIYLGCQLGSGPGEMSLEMLWADLQRIEYKGNTTDGGKSVVRVPLNPHGKTVSEMTGFLTTGGNTVFEVTYEPYVPPPYEIWAGLALFRNDFAQSNFASKYSQLGAAFLGQFWYRPEDSRLSAMVRGFGSLVSFSQSLDPPQNYDESVRTYFLDAELRYSVWESSDGWRIDPLAGGWAFFQYVQSRNFGIQRVLDPMFGFVVQKKLTRRDLLIGTFRFVPLQSFFDPTTFSPSHTYLEFELSYSHAFRKAHRAFGTLYYGSLNYQPGDGEADASGHYLVIGGGFGW